MALGLNWQIGMVAYLTIFFLLGLGMMYFVKGSGKQYIIAGKSLPFFLVGTTMCILLPNWGVISLI